MIINSITWWSWRLTIKIISETRWQRAVKIKLKTNIIRLDHMRVIQSQSSSPSRLCRNYCLTIGSQYPTARPRSHHGRLWVKAGRSAQSRSVATVFGQFCCWLFALNHSRGVFVLLKIWLFRKFKIVKHSNTFIKFLFSFIIYVITFTLISSLYRCSFVFITVIRDELAK